MHPAIVALRHLQRDIKDMPGAGSAGRPAAGALAFMNGALIFCIETVMTVSNLRAELESSGWIITVEGSFDEQSLRGKVVCGIARMALKSHTRPAVVAGQIMVPKQEYQKLWIITAIGCRTDDMSLEYGMKNCRFLLCNTARKFAKENLSG